MLSCFLFFFFSSNFSLWIPHPSPQARVAIIGLTAGGVGLDFSSAQSIVFAEVPRAAADFLQAEARAHRRGQRDPVTVTVFCAKVRGHTWTLWVLRWVPHPVGIWLHLLLALQTCSWHHAVMITAT